MIAQLAADAVINTCSAEDGWRETVVLVALIAAFCFVAWLFLRNL